MERCDCGGRPLGRFEGVERSLAVHITHMSLLLSQRPPAPKHPSGDAPGLHTAS
jgi:hypothetical protein